MWCSKCKLSSIHVKNFDRVICARGHFLCTECFGGTACPICGDRIEQKIKMFVDGTPKILFLPIDSDNDSDYRAYQNPQSAEYIDGSDNNSSILQFSSEFGSDVQNYHRPSHQDEMCSNMQVVDLHPPAKIFHSDDEDERSHTKCRNPISLKGSRSSVCIGASRSISRFKPISEESIVKSSNRHTSEANSADLAKKPSISQDPKELFLKTFYCAKSEGDNFDARSHYYKTMAELNAFRDFIVQSRMSQGDGQRRFKAEDKPSGEDTNKNINLKPHSQKIFEHLKEFRRETRYKPPKKFKVYKNYSETSGNMLITSSNSSQSTIENVEMKKKAPSQKNTSVRTHDIGTGSDDIVSLHSEVVEPPEPVTAPMVDPRAMEIREKLKAEIYSNFDKSISPQQNNSFIENGNEGISIIAYPNLATMKSMVKPENLNIENQQTSKSVSIQPLAQVLPVFPFFSTTGEQKRIEEQHKEKNAIREKLKSEIYSLFNECEKSEQPEQENPHCFIEDSENFCPSYAVKDNCNSTDSYPKLNSVVSQLNYLRALNHEEPQNDDLNLELSQYDTDEESAQTIESPIETTAKTMHEEFLYNSEMPSTATSTACRAYAYHTSAEFYKSGPPLKLIPLQTNLHQSGSCLSPIYPKLISEINIDRSPVKCPISSCQKFIFISSFSKHIKIDHQKIPIESITPGKWRNMFLDPRIDRIGVNKCQMFYLIADKITGLGNSKYKDYLPIMVMSTRINMLRMFDDNSLVRYSNSTSNNFLMIWLTGLCVSDVPIYYSLTVWSDYQNPNRPKNLKHPTTCHLVHSKMLYSIRNEQDHLNLYNSGSALIISEEQWKLLSDYGRNMIELQIFVH